MDVVYISDEFKAIVERINAKLNIDVKYFFGEDEHVVREMRDMNKAGLNKYPLIALVLPVDIVKGDSSGYDKATLPRIVIATVTDPNKPPAVRLTEVIKPVIEPIYKELINQISKNRYFSIIGNRVDHTERVRFGTQTAAQGFAEYIDGMELLDTKINIDSKHKCN